MRVDEITKGANADREEEVQGRVLGYSLMNLSESLGANSKGG